jgi:predicted DCC family thiol-disulfide oxidoreductase YuxK
MSSRPTVGSPPQKPLMVFDGDCNFCRRWISRWQQSTGNRVDYIPFQHPDVSERFPEIPREKFEGSVQLIECDGQVYSGAEAVFRSLTYARFHSWLLWLYEKVPGFASLSELAYRFVANHRAAFSALTRLLWGDHFERPSYALVHGLFLRLLGVIYFAAFVSFWLQIGGLVGSHGIIPAHETMELVGEQVKQQQIGLDRYRLFPTLCWFGASDGSLKLQCAIGAVASVLLIAGLATAPVLFLLWLLYLSLTAIGGVFLAFQWDNLLLEAGFVAVFLAPIKFWSKSHSITAPPRVPRWLLRWLLFRLTFESGCVKLLSGDPTWQNLTALNFHYETQPLPTWIGWYVHQLPGWFHSASVAIMFVIELVVPFLIFAPRRPRIVACIALVSLQLIIMATGNYCFFNLLTIALCLVLLDDAALLTCLPHKWRVRFLPPNTGAIGGAPDLVETSRGPTATSLAPDTTASHPDTRHSTRVLSWHWPVWITGPLAAMILLITMAQLSGMLGLHADLPSVVESLERWLRPFRSVNHYGLFAVMTTSRPEIVVQGSADGQKWLDYGFKYKPGDLKRRPGFVAPHQPRLDWQMWFAALGSYRNNPWFIKFCVQLLKGSPDVLALLGKNPFPDAPPRFIRAVVYDYHFTDLKARRKEGAWWRREFKENYCPVLSLRDNQ